VKTTAPFTSREPPAGKSATAMILGLFDTTGADVEITKLAKAREIKL
jgi:hypothetical protein